MVFAIGCVILVVGGGCCIGLLHGHHTRETEKFHAEVLRQRWDRQRKHRDDLLDTAKRIVASYGFRVQQVHEDPWSYAKAFDVWACKQLNMAPQAQWGKLYEASSSPLALPRMSNFFKRTKMSQHDVTYVGWTSFQTFWWTTECNGLVHRVVSFKLDDRDVFMLRCSLDTRVPPEYAPPEYIDQHLVGTGPILTCLHCFQMVPK